MLVAAADTFRAAAIDQLQVWCDRSGADIIKHGEGSDPAAVVYDAMDAAKARRCYSGYSRKASHKEKSYE